MHMHDNFQGARRKVSTNAPAARNHKAIGGPGSGSTATGPSSTTADEAPSITTTTFTAAATTNSSAAASSGSTSFPAPPAPREVDGAAD